MKLKVYSTDGCSICEQVIDKLFETPLGEGIELTVVDVSFHEDLLVKYGPDIPVLEIENRLLRSPFDDEEMMGFLNSAI